MLSVLAIHNSKQRYHAESKSCIKLYIIYDKFVFISSVLSRFKLCNGNVSIKVINLPYALMQSAPFCRWYNQKRCWHYSDVIMGATASQVTRLMIVYSIVHSGVDQKKISKLRVTDRCAGNSPVAAEFPAQRVSDAENGSISWHHECPLTW